MKCFILLLAVSALTNGLPMDDSADHMMMMHHSHHSEFYKSKGRDDLCAEMPATPSMGMARTEACKGATESAEVCVCMKYPDDVITLMKEQGKDLSKMNAQTGYINECGHCENPCALKWNRERMNSTAPAAAHS